MVTTEAFEPDSGDLTINDLTLQNGVANAGGSGNNGGGTHAVSGAKTLR